MAAAAEAALMLMVAKVLLRTLALPRWSTLLGQPTNTDGLDVNGSPAKGREGVVALGIARAAYRLQGSYTCLLGKTGVLTGRIEKGEDDLTPVSAFR
jgi:hypothetical protein